MDPEGGTLAFTLRASVWLYRYERTKQHANSVCFTVSDPFPSKQEVNYFLGKRQNGTHCWTSPSLPCPSARDRLSLKTARPNVPFGTGGGGDFNASIPSCPPSFGRKVSNVYRIVENCETMPEGIERCATPSAKNMADKSASGIFWCPSAINVGCLRHPINFAHCTGGLIRLCLGSVVVYDDATALLHQNQFLRLQETTSFQTIEVHATR
jgi:hypothetical protein